MERQTPFLWVNMLCAFTCSQELKNGHSLKGIRRGYWLLALTKDINPRFESEGGDKVMNLTFFFPSPLVYMSWQHVAMCMGDLMSRKGLSDQTPGVCHLQPHAFFFYFWPVRLCSVVWLFSLPCNTWESCRGGKKKKLSFCQLPNTFQLQMPGHSRTLLAFFHLKVQPSFVFPHHIIHLYAGMDGNI